MRAKDDTDVELWSDDEEENQNGEGEMENEKQKDENKGDEDNEGSEYSCSECQENDTQKTAKDTSQTDLKHKRRVTFTIRDTGCGISESFLEKMFVPFEQEESNRNRLVKGVEGTGLGLSIVKALMDEMGGTIQVSSYVGQGT